MSEWQQKESIACMLSLSSHQREHALLLECEMPLTGLRFWCGLQLVTPFWKDLETLGGVTNWMK